jgi:hypothetical protein
MKQVNIQISEMDYIKYGLSNTSIDFKDLLNKIRIELAKEALKKCQELAGNAGLSSMSMEDINQEIKIVRDAKNNS